MKIFEDLKQEFKERKEVKHILSEDNRNFC
jgi:hypothetical protein